MAGMLKCICSEFRYKKGILECVRMMAKLKLALGDRKIDVIGDYEDNPVVKEALLTGIRLV